MPLDEKPIILPYKTEETSVELGNIVTLFNDEQHSYEQVTNQVMLATKCSEREAFKIAYLVDHKGSAIVFRGELDDCIRVSSILEKIGLKTTISV